MKAKESKVVIDFSNDPDLDSFLRHIGSHLEQQRALRTPRLRIMANR